MKISFAQKGEMLKLEARPPLAIYVSSVCVLCVGVGAAWYFGGGWLFYSLELIVSLYMAWTVLEDSEEVCFSSKDDSVSITRISPIGHKSVVKGKLSEIVSIRLDEQLSQMWGKMTRVSLLFESGQRLPLTLAFSTAPQDHLVTAIDEFLESVAPQLADDLYGDVDDKDEDDDDEEEVDIPLIFFLSFFLLSSFFFSNGFCSLFLLLLRNQKSRNNMNNIISLVFRNRR
jgi:hypothetical protein